MSARFKLICSLSSFFICYITQEIRFITSLFLQLNSSLYQYPLYFSSNISITRIFYSFHTFYRICNWPTHDRCDFFSNKFNEKSRSKSNWECMYLFEIFNWKLVTFHTIMDNSEVETVCIQKFKQFLSLFEGDSWEAAINTIEFFFSKCKNVSFYIEFFAMIQFFLLSFFDPMVNRAYFIITLNDRNTNPMIQFVNKWCILNIKANTFLGLSTNLIG